MASRESPRPDCYRYLFHVTSLAESRSRHRRRFQSIRWSRFSTPPAFPGSTFPYFNCVCASTTVRLLLLPLRDMCVRAHTRTHDMRHLHPHTRVRVHFAHTHSGGGDVDGEVVDVDFDVDNDRSRGTENLLYIQRQSEPWSCDCVH